MEYETQDVQASPLPLTQEVPSSQPPLDMVNLKLSLQSDTTTDLSKYPGPPIPAMITGLDAEAAQPILARLDYEQQRARNDYIAALEVYGATYATSKVSRILIDYVYEDHVRTRQAFDTNVVEFRRARNRPSQDEAEDAALAQLVDNAMVELPTQFFYHASTPQDDPGIGSVGASAPMAVASDDDGTSGGFAHQGDAHQRNHAVLCEVCNMTVQSACMAEHERGLRHQALAAGIDPEYMRGYSNFTTAKRNKLREALASTHTSAAGKKGTNTRHEQCTPTPASPHSVMRDVGRQARRQQNLNARDKAQFAQAARASQAHTSPNQNGGRHPTLRVFVIR